MSQRFKREFKFRNSDERIPNIIRKSNIPLRRFYTASFIDHIAALYRKQLLKQLRFTITIRGRFAYKQILLKTIKDESITVTKYVLFQLINCKSCGRLAKADLHISRTCRTCNNHNKGIQDYNWTAWAKNV